MKEQETISVTTDSASATAALARRIGERLPAGTVIAARGDLGVGKTVFAAGLGAGLGVSEPVVSPTYIFFNDYQGRLPFCHIDAYRLEGLEEEELALIGLDDCFSREKAVFCEWPDFIRQWLPPETIRLTISRGGGPEERRLDFTFDKEQQEWLHDLLSH